MFGRALAPVVLHPLKYGVDNLGSDYCNSVESELRRPFVTSCRVRNANPRTNAYFIAFVIGEHAVLKNWFIHLAIYTKTNKCYSLILMVLCYSMITCHDCVLL